MEMLCEEISPQECTWVVGDVLNHVNHNPQSEIWITKSQVTPRKTSMNVNVKSCKKQNIPSGCYILSILLRNGFFKYN